MHAHLRNLISTVETIDYEMRLSEILHVYRKGSLNVMPRTVVGSLDHNGPLWES